MWLEDWQKGGGGGHEEIGGGKKIPVVSLEEGEEDGGWGTPGSHVVVHLGHSREDDGGVSEVLQTMQVGLELGEQEVLAEGHHGLQGWGGGGV